MQPGTVEPGPGIDDRQPALDWGIHIDRVEIKDVALLDSMKRSMSRQAGAERGTPGPGNRRGR
jgi:regulator of protease activity HflC (stomatin/prohibitin superfamily)